MLEKGDPDHILPAIHNLVRFGAISGVIPSLAWITKPLLWSLNPGLSPAVIGRETAKCVNAKYESIANGSFYDDNDIPQRRDLLTGFVECKNYQTKKSFTKAETMSTATSIFAAGVDSTLSCCIAFFYNIIQSPGIYARLLEELDVNLRSRSISLPLSYAAGTKLPYFQACLKEAIRLMPGGMELPRYLPAGGILVAEQYFLPEGTEIGCPWPSFHRSQAAFGEDAATFRPERWLDLGPEERAALERNNLAVSPTY